MKKIILLILMSFMSIAGYSQLPAFEGFENAAFPPPGWLVTDNGVGSAQQWKFNAPNPPYTAYEPTVNDKAAFIDRENTGQGVLSEEWLITPQVNVLANRQFRFFTRQTVPGDTGTRYQIRVSSDANQANLAAYTILADYSETDLSTETASQIDYEEKVINLAFSGNRYFAFVKVFTQPGTATSGDRWLVDAVKIVQRCVEPTALNVDGGVTCTSAVLGWTGPAGATYNIEYGISGFTPGTGTVITGVTGTTYNLTGLSASSDYQFYVTAVCSSLGSSSQQTGPFNFSTITLGSLCSCPLPVPTLPFSDCNDTAVFGNNITNPNPGGAAGCGGGAGTLAGNDVVYSFTVPATTTGLISISMNPNGATNTSLFVYSSCANIGVSCIGGVANATSSIRNITSLAVTAGQTIYVVVSSTAATPSFPYCLIIQDVNCVPPTALGLTTPPPANPTTTEAFLKWSNGPGGVSTSYQVVVQLAGSPIPTGPGATTTNNINFPASTANGGPLTPDTAYQFWVRGDCNNGTFSAWSGPFPFTTLPTCPKPTALTAGAVLSTSAAITFTNNSSATEFHYLALDAGSTPPTIGTTGFTIFTSTSYTILGLTPDTCYDIYVRANCGAVDGFSQWVPLLNVCTQIAPPVCGGTYVDPGGALANYPANANTTVTICPTNPGDLVTVTFTSFATESTWDGILVYDGDAITDPQISSGNPTGNGPFTTLPGAFWGAAIPGPFTSSSLDGCLTFRFLSDGSQQLAGFVANVTCAPAPPCPKSTTIAATAVTINSATISWLSPPNATTFEILVLPAGSPAPAPDATGGSPATPSPFNLTGLTPDTCYDVYIRNNCGVNGFSVWSTAFATFCTLPTCPKPTNLVLDNVLSTSMELTFTNNSTATTFDVLALPCGSPAPTAASTGFTTTSTLTDYLISALTADTCYDIYVRANCGPGDLSTWAGPATATTQQIPPACGGTFSDLGGSSANYPDSADSTVTICPTNPGDVVTVIFTQFNTEANWDGLLVYDGNSTAAPQIPSTNGTGNGPFADIAGAYWGNTIPGPFESTSLDGCLTFHFLSDTIFNFEGFLANVTCAPAPPCQKATAIASSNITTTSATITWVSPSNAVSYEVLALPAGSPAPGPLATGVPATGTPFDLTGLASDTCYDVYVRNNCGPIDGVSVWSFVKTTFCTLIVPPACGGTFSDPGGAGQNYPSQANSVVTICPPAGQLVTVTFTSFATEANWDGLLVFNGDSTAAPQISSGNPAGNGGLPAGSFWGNTIPGPFTADNQTGCLTFQFISDFSQNLAGWTSLVTCEPAPTCFRPTNVAVSNIDTFGATITWTSPPNAVSYEVLALPTGSPAPLPTDSGVFAGSNPFNLTGLAPLTCYDIYVRNNCGPEDGLSNWSIIAASFCTLPTCPQPINLTVESNDEDSAILTWTAVGPATQWQIIVQPLGGPIPDFNSTGTIVTGTPPTISFDTTVIGPLAAGFYEFYVQALCTAPDESTWNGPEPFYISPPPPVCAGVDISIATDPPGVINFCPGDNTQNLSASFTASGDTTSYGVLPIAYAPPFPFTGGTQLPVDDDDLWSAPFTLPFNFCFFGTNYPAVQVGSNGVVSFNTNYPVLQNGSCPWNTTPGVTVPNAAFPILNAIYGVYQDIDPSVSGTTPSINYQVLGTAPCRAFVINYYQVGQFSCLLSVGLQTSQIVLYETSNIIEVYVQDRTACPQWNEGAGVIGIQNNAGTQGYTPPGRNLGAWEAHDEAWRFTPSGPSNVVFSWLQNGDFYSNDTNITVDFNSTTVMTAQAVYTGCGGTIVTKTEDVLLQINPIDVPQIDDVNQCEPYELPVLTNVVYYTLPGGPDTPGNEVVIGPITSGTQTIYAYGSTPTTPSCHDEESFVVTIGTAETPEVTNVSDCVSYTLPDLTLQIPGFTGAYFTGIDGTGETYPATGGTVISTPGITTIYVYVVNGICIGQVSFEIYIGPPQPEDFADVSDCNGYVLPEFTLPNNTYWTLSGGPDTPGNVQLFPNDTVNTSQTIYVWASNGTGPSCTAESDFVITIDGVVPTFDPIPNVCLNGPAPVLPPTSLNGIIGAWACTIDTTVVGTTTCTFNPNLTIPGQECATTATLTVTVIDQIVPVFNLVTDICLNGAAPLLPAADDNGITGTWAPATIDTSVAGPATAIFTPDVTIPTQSCAIPLTVTFNINSQITPTFDPIANVCQNATAPILPPASLGGITGSWSPDTVDTTVAGTFTFTFTPDTTVVGQECAVPTDITVTVDLGLVPTFDPISVCLGDAATLPTLSLEGLAGTWSPSTIDTSVAGTFTYTFTPTITLCTENGSLTVTIIAPIDPGFNDLTICSGSVAPLLVTTSPTGVTGTWLPDVIDNTTPATYTFTPDAGQCAAIDQISVSITPQTVPDFAAIGPLCSGSTAPLLGSTSPNGVNGIWAPATIDTSIAGLFSYVFTPDTGLCATTQTLTVTINQSDTPDFVLTPSYCSGAEIPALVNTSPNMITGTWSPAVVDNTTSGTYTFTPDAGQVCANPFVYTVTIDDLPDFQIVGACNGNNFVLSVIEPNNLAEGVTYAWSNADGPIANGTGPTLTITATGTYTLKIFNGGCSSERSITANSVACTIQKGISPTGTNGGDGKNDYFDLEGRNVRKLGIFNRYGSEVYSQMNYSKEWYGQSNKGDELPDGTYYYVIEYNYATDPVTGWIYINREQ